MFATDRDSERATDIDDYRRTCSEFIIDISNDYKDWVDRYDLNPDEARNHQYVDKKSLRLNPQSRHQYERWHQ
jgi:hypothetical protein